MVPNVQTLHPRHLNWLWVKEKEIEGRKKMRRKLIFFSFLLLSVPDSIRYLFWIVSIACNRCDLIFTENRHRRRKKTTWKKETIKNMRSPSSMFFLLLLLVLMPFVPLRIVSSIIRYSCYESFGGHCQYYQVHSRLMLYGAKQQQQQQQNHAVESICNQFPIASSHIHESCNHWTSVDTHTCAQLSYIQSSDWTNMKFATR